MRVALTLFLMLVAFLLGMVSEKMLDSRRRDEVIGRYERALADWHAMRIRSEAAGRAAIEERRRTAPEESLADR